MYRNPPEAVAWAEDEANWPEEVQWAHAQAGGHFFGFRGTHCGQLPEAVDEPCDCDIRLRGAIHPQTHTIPWTQEDEEAYWDYARCGEPESPDCDCAELSPQDFIGGETARAEWLRRRETAWTIPVSLVKHRLVTTYVEVKKEEQEAVKSVVADLMTDALAQWGVVLDGSSRVATALLRPITPLVPLPPPSPPPGEWVDLGNGRSVYRPRTP